MCKGCGQYVAQCLTRNLLIERADLDNDKYKEIYELEESACNVDENIRVVCNQLSVTRGHHVESKTKNWRTSCVFDTYVAMSQIRVKPIK